MESAFTITPLRPGVMQIGNAFGDCCTLVLGEQRALLFDTMRGLGDLQEIVSQLTPLPVTVVNSHGHFDHVGGNAQFEPAYLHPLDFGVMARSAAILPEIEKNTHHRLPRARESLANWQSQHPLRDGQIFDLGGIVAEAIALPGHTAGSMGLMLHSLETLLVGDAISPVMCLFYPDSLELEVYRQTLEKVMNLDFQWFIQGHYSTLFPKSIIKRFYECSLLPGEKSGQPYVNTQIPEYRGQLYLLELRNPEIDEMICLITKESQNA